MDMKRTILLLLLTAFSTSHLLADDFDLYLIGLEDTGYTSLDLANLRSLSFKQERQSVDGSTVYLNQMTANYNDGTSNSFDLANYSSLQFLSTTVGMESVSAVSNTDAAFHLEGNTVVAHQAGTLTIYQLDGRPAAATATTPGQSVSLFSLAPGFYIVHLGGTSAKILLK